MTYFDMASWSWPQITDLVLLLLETGDWSLAECVRMSVESADAFMAARKGSAE